MAIILGTLNEDNLEGLPENDIIQALDGNDIVQGDQGDDVIQGNEGNDQLFGGEGDDVIQGGAGNDRIWGDSGNDVLQGGAGNDTFIDSAGVNYFDGGEGNDTVEFKNLINSGIKLNLAEGTASYTDEQDQEVAQTLISIERAVGTNFNDELIGNEANNIFFGLEGDDKYVGGAGHDTFIDSSGVNYFDGGEGNDTVNFQNLINSGIKLNLAEGTASYTDEQDQEVAQTLISIERAVGTNFNDELIGNEANNIFFGLEGDDKYIGGAGHDTFIDSGGVNYFDGGEGNDTVEFQNLINSGIKLNLAEGTASYTDEQDQEVAQTLISIERAVGTNFNDELIGNEANNIFFGLEGDDKYIGGAGNDTFIDSGGVNYFDGGEGNDTVEFQNLINSGIKLNLAEGTASYTDDQDQEVTQTLISIERAVGTNFNDELIGNEANNIFFGLEGDDKYIGGAGNDTFIDSAGVNYFDGGEGRDTVNFQNLINSGIKLNLAEGTASYTDEQDQELAQTLISIERAVGTNFNDELIGNEANNIFFGLEGDDTITGGAGNDVINTGDGNNTIDSGSGVDTIELGNGNNTIALEEGEGHDKVINFQLGLTRFGVSDASTLTFEQSNGSVNIIAADGDLLANVEGVEVSTFTDNLSTIFF